VGDQTLRIRMKLLAGRLDAVANEHVMRVDQTQKIRMRIERKVTGKISQAAASAVGIRYTDNRFTVGNPSVSVAADARTSGTASEYQNYVSTN
jgi:hypothetical protein